LMELQQDTRARILLTALELFALRGYESVGVMEISEKSGISKPTLYHHFGNKRGLLDAVIGVYGAEMLRIVELGTRYNHDLVLNLTMLTREMVSFGVRNQPFYRFYLALSASPPESEGYAAFETFRRTNCAYLEKLFTSASSDHRNMRNREKAYSETFQGMMRTWTLLVINGEAEFNDDLLYRAVHQFMHGIFS